MGLEDQVIVYSPHGKEILSDFKTQFETAYPGTRVDFIYLPSQECLDRIRNEKQNPQADIWWGAGHTTFMTAARQDLLEPYRPTWADQIEPDHRDAEDRWYAGFLSPEIIFYNSEMIPPEDAPKDWADLVSAKYREKVLMRYPIPSDTMRAIYFGMIARSIAETGNEEKAFEWMKGLDANTKEYVSGGELVFRKMSQRLGAISVWTLSDIMLQRTRYKFPFEIVYPASGSPVILDGIAVVKGCRHPKAARAYYEFVTSATSAVHLANEPYFRISTRKDLPLDQLPEWMRELKYTPQPLDWSIYIEKMNDWMRRWEEEVKSQGLQTP